MADDVTESIVVGVDGSPGATEAVLWAADEAARRHLPLRIVHVLEFWPYDISKFPPEVPEAVAEAAERILAEAETVAREHRPEIRTSTEVLKGVPAKVLREQVTPRSELVLGCRGLGGFAGTLLGSVSTHVAGQAHGPVVVVRPDGEARTDGNHGDVVVGVDDSEECEPALAYAFEQARLRGARIRAVYAWQLLAGPYGAAMAYAPSSVWDMAEVRRDREETAAAKLAPWRRKFPEVEVSLEVPCAHPVDALTEASTGAALLVVGSHGRGAIGSVVLGSVSRAVLHHAHCPVAVIRS
ncbi:universal stress protein [Acrocarpospora catenulata]|uniref:universal stress protein n=1 Tax=Acrocarpospora catenulata TaxID=2836182 RepID=UPI0020239EA4|nr:universal stress protein [Acrocarpospora catenulata]